MKQIHAALIIVDAAAGITDLEKELWKNLEKEGIPCLYVFNKIDQKEGKEDPLGEEEKTKEAVWVSAVTGENIGLLKEKMASLCSGRTERKLAADLLSCGDHVLLVVPIDAGAPKGRLILPQQQTIRDILEAGGIVLVCQPETVQKTLELMKQPPKIVITDSQVFGQVKNLIPEEIMLTSFSILFARYKGNLGMAVRGALKLDEVKDEDTILISEGCTHHRQCGDIGTRKLPSWILEYTGKKLKFEFTSGNDFPEDLTKYALIIHCGGCMLNEKQMQFRRKMAEEQQIMMTNYGIAIAHMNGILRRSIEPFGEEL